MNCQSKLYVFLVLLVINNWLSEKSETKDNYFLLPMKFVNLSAFFSHIKLLGISLGFHCTDNGMCT